jgi:hypothetical protein
MEPGNQLRRHLPSLRASVLWAASTLGQMSFGQPSLSVLAVVEWTYILKTPLIHKLLSLV